jgi:UV DNA damage repair endonuclease
MRLSSEMFPFASHAEYGYDLEFADKDLKEAGDLAKKYGHRLTAHPGQVSFLCAFVGEIAANGSSHNSVHLNRGWSLLVSESWTINVR